MPAGDVIRYVRNIDKDTMFERLVKVVDAQQVRIERLEQIIDDMKNEKKEKKKDA